MSLRLFPGWVTGLVVALLLLTGSGEAIGKTKITWYFGLARPEAKARNAFYAVSDPSSGSYRNFRTTAQIRSGYGASPRTISRLRKVLRKRRLGLRVDPTGTFARITGTPRRFEKVFRVKVVRQQNDGPPLWSWTAKRRPRLPAPMKPLIREVMPIFDRTASGQASTSVARSSRISAAGPGPKPVNDGTWSSGCKAAEQTGGYSFDQVREAYGIDSLGNGDNASIAIMNAGESVTKKDMAVADACFGRPGIKPRYLLTDGQKGPFTPYTFEPDIDLALARGMAPGVSQVTYTQTWVNPQFWFLGPAQVFRMRRLPDVLSVSYGVCQSQVYGKRPLVYMPAAGRLFESLVLRLGLAGVGTYAASGDSGSTCNGSDWPGVAWPAASPFVTAVGGTRLIVDQTNRRTDEVVWNDLPWLSTSDGGGAGGGGFAAFAKRPPFQSDLAIRGSRRTVPDVSAHASALPGWPVNLSTNWSDEAGTSASTPLVAAAMAIISGNERAAGRAPVGPAAGLFYWLDGNGSPPFFDVTRGNNGMSGKVKPRYARPGYDLATGLGVPLFGEIPGLLPAASGAPGRPNGSAGSPSAES
jgi:kumamolisin